MIGAASSPEVLAQQHPEWQPWLGLLAESLQVLGDPGWEACVPAPAAGRPDKSPLLADTAVAIDRRFLARWIARMLRRAAALVPATRPLHDALEAGHLEPLQLFEASVEDDAKRLQALAAQADAEPAPLKALAIPIAMPLLYAAQRKLGAAVAADWLKGYCPICGAWPILAEDRGLERARRLRCTRCGADWPGDWLRCPYCDERDHTRLGSLVPGSGGETRRVETCLACRGYLKTHTRLQGTPAAELPLEDLSSIELDVAALDHGYARPAGPGYALGIKIVAAPARRARILGWRP